MFLAGTVTASACTVAEPQYLRVERTPMAEGVRLRLVPVGGARINARLAPVLELPDGGVVSFAGGELTPDSAYFTTPPEAIAGAPAVGIIRASICPAGEGVCRVVVVRSEK